MIIKHIDLNVKFNNNVFDKKFFDFIDNKIYKQETGLLIKETYIKRGIYLIQNYGDANHDLIEDKIRYIIILNKYTKFKHIEYLIGLNGYETVQVYNPCLDRSLDNRTIVHRTNNDESEDIRFNIRKIKSKYRNHIIRNY